MTLRIVFRRAAKNEFEDAAVRYDVQRPGLGEEFTIEIAQAVARAAAAPERYPIIFGAQSRAVFHFPFTSGFALIRWLSSRYFTVAAIQPSGSVGYSSSRTGRAKARR